MQLATHGMRDIVEVFSHEDTLVAGKRNGLGKTGGIDIVGRTPRAIHPMGSGLKNIVLKIMLIEK